MAKNSRQACAVREFKCELEEKLEYLSHSISSHVASNKFHKMPTLQVVSTAGFRVNSKHRFT